MKKQRFAQLSYEDRINTWAEYDSTNGLGEFVAETGRDPRGNIESGTIIVRNPSTGSIDTRGIFLAGYIEGVLSKIWIDGVRVEPKVESFDEEVFFKFIRSGKSFIESPVADENIEIVEDDGSTTNTGPEGVAPDEDGIPYGRIAELLKARPDEAKRMLHDLQDYPSEVINDLLQDRFDYSSNGKVRRRIVWAVGELSEQYGLDFLIGCTSSDDTHMRRLAASALGKVARKNPRFILDNPGIAGASKRALLGLSTDEHRQVREYAEKALDKFPTGS